MPTSLSPIKASTWCGTMAGTATLAEGSGRRRRNRRRGQGPDVLVEVSPPPCSRGFKQRWAHDIRQVYAVDPLLRLQCGGLMRISAFIDQPEVIEKILSH